MFLQGHILSNAGDALLQHDLCNGKMINNFMKDVL
jgi:hypothetical protein